MLVSALLLGIPTSDIKLFFFYDLHSARRWGLLWGSMLIDVDLLISGIFMFCVKCVQGSKKGNYVCFTVGGMGLTQWVRNGNTLGLSYQCQ